MKKFKTLLISSMIGAMVFGMSGCKASTSNDVTTDTTSDTTDTIAPHTHAYDDGVVTTPATCTEDGVMTFTCECGDTYTEVITALGHTETSTHTVATLDTPAFDTVTCSVCEEELRTENEDLWTARGVVQAFADVVFEDPSNSVRGATLQDGTEVRYTGANFGTNLGTPSDAINVVMNAIFADLDGLDLYQGSTSDGDDGYYALYTYESDYTFLVVEVDSYLNSTNTIIQVMSYLEDAR